MIIGIDFDNTIATYDALLRRLMREHGWALPSLLADKTIIRNTLRRMHDGEQLWQAMQAEAYGVRMEEAELLPGAVDFILACRDFGHEVRIISHKTRFAAAAPQGPDLRQAAMAWMEKRNFFKRDELGFLRADISFEDSRAEKCKRIGAVECEVFIDDLPEVFADPEFPQGVRPYLLSAQTSDIPDGVRAFSTWKDIHHDILA